MSERHHVQMTVTRAIEEVTSCRCELTETTYAMHEIRAAMQLTKMLHSVYIRNAKSRAQRQISHSSILSSWCHHGVQAVLTKREIAVLCSNMGQVSSDIEYGFQNLESLLLCERRVHSANSASEERDIRFVRSRPGPEMMRVWERETGLHRL